MKKFSKILSAMLALLLLFSMTLLFSSCGSEEEEVTPGADGTISTEEGLPPLDVKNLGGKEMLMLWPEMHADGHYLHNELAVAESSGDVIDQAVMQRNTIVQSAYNVKITTQTMFISDVAKTVRNEYNGGTSTYSALACSINNSNLIALQQEGGLADFNSLEYYDESQPWWNHDLMQDLSIANARYFASGDIIYSDDFYPYATFVNDKLSANSGITENYHELVKNKEWTLEKFHTLAAQAKDDQIDGDPNTWSNQDINGAVINENFAKAAYYSAGKGMVGFDSKGYPVWQMDVAWTQPILNQLKKHTDAKIITMSPYILDAEINKLFPLDTPSGENMRKDLARIAPTIRALANEYAEDFIPLDEIFEEALKTQPQPMYYSDDGIHPNANGAEFIGRICADRLKKLLTK